MKFIISLTFLVGCCTIVAQPSQFQLRYNLIGYHYFYPFAFFPMDYKVVNSHFFQYNNAPSNSNASSAYNFYYLGLGFQKDNVLKEFFLRGRIDRFSYQENNYGNLTDTSGKVIQVYATESNLSSMQYTIGIGKKNEHKRLTFYYGIELPVYLRSIGKYESHYYSANSSYSYYYYTPNGNFVGLSLFGNISYNVFRQFYIGIEGAAGIIYYKYFWNKAYTLNNSFTSIPQTRPNLESGIIPMYHMPSITFSYQF